MDIIYYDENLIVCIKPAGVLSTDEEGGMPSLLRAALGDESADIRAVHRLDQVVSGIMVYALNAEAAGELSRQIRCGEFHKSYLAVIHGVPEAKSGRYEDQLLRNKEQRRTFVVNKPCRGSQEAVLDYELISTDGQHSLVAVSLITGRTHQIRAQFSHRRLPLMGDKKYGLGEDSCPIALWSHSLSFLNPKTGRRMSFKVKPPQSAPWTLFKRELIK